ncbi:MAG TPA: sterol desaturase family protein [Bdellovibrionota bacterium]|jgi:sterol desaturase/sphingolipid hydroxylase (fatty acid hydroxylase superfamily)
MGVFAYIKDNWYAGVALPVLVMFQAILAEWLYCRLFLRGKFAWREGLISTPIALGEMVAAIGLFYFQFYFFRGLEKHSLFHLSGPGWEWYLLYYFTGEFIFYMAHYSAHHFRWFWADHSVHHSSVELNYFAGNRNGWFALVGGLWIFTIPFVWLGFPWMELLKVLAVILSYQFYIHTEVVRRLGPLEYLINTPSLHRVHHGKNPEYINKNFGGILMIFDYAFGTLQREIPGVKIQYGLTDQPSGLNPFRYVFHGWAGLFRDGWRKLSGSISGR